MRHGSLFSGIGGFDLAADWMGWENVFHCEINPFGQKVLKHYWPDADLIEDITKFDFKKYAGTIDIISGGFPCQPFSLAGKRKGTEDDRHLWPEMLRVIREVHPTWVVGENVFGLINWDGGLVFDQVQSDLEAEGYEVQPYVLPAVSVDAPHRRDRIWFVAYRTSELQQRDEPGECRNKGREDVQPEYGQTNTIQPGTMVENGIITNPGLFGQEIGQQQSMGSVELCEERTTADTASNGGVQNNGEREPKFANQNGKRPNWQNFPAQSPVRTRNDGFSRPLVRYVTKELRDAISNTSEENRIENLSEMWKRISQEKVWQKIRRFYSLESQEILFQTMQLYQTGHFGQNELSPFSEKISEPILSKLRKHGEFRCSPQGQKLEKQRSEKLGDIVSYLPHEIPLAARAFETSISKFDAWHRNESIKAYGNAIVPQVAFQIFQAIGKYQ